MVSRKQFIELNGATCRNWNWSWSFVNHEERFVIFGLWDIHKDGLIFKNTWEGNGRKQSLEHIDLVENQGYRLKTFLMEYGQTESGNAKIKSFSKTLEDKLLFGNGGNWYALNEDMELETPIPEEVANAESYVEGATKKISVNAYERNAEARAKCIELYGYKCYVCDFDFFEAYGDLGKDYIHVHHEVPLSTIKKEYTVSPEEDLKPLCPNCHAMIHRTREAIQVDELKDIVSKNR